MKFVHVADMHFDAPFTSLNAKEDLSDKRRLEQRNVFRKVIDYVRKNNIEYLFISGDLYEEEYVKKSTVDFIIAQFQQIPNTKIFITPGNHDPYIKNSPYDKYDFGENVNIFSNSYVERYEDENVDIYGMGFNSFYMEENVLEKIKIKNQDKINILIAHADLNGGKDEDGLSYNPISEPVLREIGFDYIALGHIHKSKIDNSRICYPGSTISLGFDELGAHGMVVGEITKESFNIEFIELDDRKFEEIELNVENIFSKEELIEVILLLELKKENIYKVILVGKRNFEIAERDILRAVSRSNILKIKNHTTINYDIEELAKQRNLKGMFIGEVINKYNLGLISEEECQKIIEIGLEVM